MRESQFLTQGLAKGVLEMPNEAKTTRRSRLDRLKRLVGLARGEDALPHDMVAAQIRAARESYPVTFAATCLACAAIFWTTWGDAQLPPMMMATGFLLVVSILNLVFWRRDVRAQWVIDDPRRRVVSVALMSGITAVAWNVLLGVGMYGASANQSLLLVCISTGVICVGALSVATVPLASIAFMLSSFVVVFVNLQFFNNILPAEVYFMIAIYIVMLTRSILAQANLFIANYDSGSRLGEAELERERLAQAALQERERARFAKAHAEADERTRAASSRHVQLVALAETFESTVVEAVAVLGAAAERNRQSAEALVAGSAESARYAETAATRAHHNSQISSDMRGAASGLARSVGEVTERASEQSRIAAEAHQVSRDSEAAVKALVEHAEGISHIVALIGEVTRQTNMLSLNATIEAARAGDAGRGFAVVANEVKLLADRARKATEDIARQIAEMQAHVGSAASTIAMVTNHIGGVARLAGEIEAMMADQRRMAARIDDQAALAAEGTQDLTDGAEHAARASQGSSALSAAMADTVSGLAERSQALAAATRAFLEELRAA